MSTRLPKVRLAEWLAGLAIAPGYFCGFHFANGEAARECGLAVVPALFIAGPIGAAIGLYVGAGVGFMIELARRRASGTP